MWIRSVHFEIFWQDFVAQTFALIAPGWPILHRVLCISETVPNAHKRKETYQNMSLGSNGVDRERSLRKIQGRNRGMKALIAPVWLVLHQVSCSSETVQNALDRKETHQNMILGSNSVDRECSLQKNLTRHRGLNFCINCTSLARFAASFVQ